MDSLTTTPRVSVGASSDANPLARYQRRLNGEDEPPNLRDFWPDRDAFDDALDTWQALGHTIKQDAEAYIIDERKRRNG